MVVTYQEGTKEVAKEDAHYGHRVASRSQTYRKSVEEAKALSCQMAANKAKDLEIFCKEESNKIPPECDQLQEIPFASKVSLPITKSYFA